SVHPIYGGHTPAITSVVLVRGSRQRRCPMGRASVDAPKRPICLGRAPAFRLQWRPAGGHMRYLIVLAAFSSVACVMPIDIAGGPRNANYRLEPKHLGEQLRPIVADEPEALTRIDEIEHDERVSKVSMWTGFGLLGGCLAVSAAENTTTQMTGAT